MRYCGLEASRGPANLSWFLLAVAFALLTAGSVSARPPESVGETIFKSKCATCHGPDGSGQTSMGKMMKLRDLRSAEVQKQTDAQLAQLITNGKSPMPAYGKQLDKEKIEQVVSYLRELAKKH